jgi:corrinoid protein of di/trimethylamine methyltransferase
MSIHKDQLYEKLATAVVELDEDLAKSLSQEAVDKGYDAWETIEHGLVEGVDRAGKLFDEETYFIPELLIAADAMYAGLDILKPHVKRNEHATKRRVVIGVIEGDTHDIGKNLVRLMLDVGGFEVFDLGRDVPPRAFTEKAKEVGAELIAISTLMTTTMDGIAEVIRILKAENIRDQFKVIVGGAPISQSFADRIGADGYSAKASAAVQLAKRLLQAKEEVAA